MFPLLLTLHLAGAAYSSLLILQTLTHLPTTSFTLLQTLSRHLSLTTLYLIVTGCLLTLLSPSTNLTTFCTRITLYFTIILFTQALIYFKLHSHHLHFPTTTFTRTLLTSLLLTILTGITL